MLISDDQPVTTCSSCLRVAGMRTRYPVSPVASLQHPPFTPAQSTRTHHTSFIVFCLAKTDNRPYSLRDQRRLMACFVVSIVLTQKVTILILSKYGSKFLSKIRRWRKHLLAFYPEDVRLKKIASRCMIIARSGHNKLLILHTLDFSVSCLHAHRN